jgi:hypothetical protein
MVSLDHRFVAAVCNASRLRLAILQIFSPLHSSAIRFGSIP